MRLERRGQFGRDPRERSIEGPGGRSPGMDPTPYDYSTETLLRRKARDCAELRELLLPVAQELERVACEHPELGNRLLVRAMRLRRRLWEALR